MIDGVRLSEADKAYFAGLIDTVGAIHVMREYHQKKVVRREIVLDLLGLRSAQVSWIVDRIKGAREYRTGIRLVTRWAATALLQAMDYLVATKSEAGLVFKFASAVASKSSVLTQQQLEIRAQVDVELAALKKGA